MPSSKPKPASETDLPRAICMPATRALTAAGYTRLDQLARLTEADLLALHGVGPKAIRILREALSERGRSFNGSGNTTR